MVLSAIRNNLRDSAFCLVLDRVRDRVAGSALDLPIIHLWARLVNRVTDRAYRCVLENIKDA